jgi:hypothetical protein
MESYYRRKVGSTEIVAAVVIVCGLIWLEVEHPHWHAVALLGLFALFAIMATIRLAVLIFRFLSE